MRIRAKSVTPYMICFKLAMFRILPNRNRAWTIKIADNGYAHTYRLYARWSLVSLPIDEDAKDFSAATVNGPAQQKPCRQPRFLPASKNDIRQLPLAE